MGWPDLLTWREPRSGTVDGPDNGKDEVLLVEVKSSSDRLSEDQRTWIELNDTELHLPFELAKVHRAESV